MRANVTGTADVLAVVPASRPGPFGWGPPLPILDAEGRRLGRLWGVECKLGRGRPRPAQAAWGRALEAAGGLYFVCRDVRDLEELLKREGVI